MVANVASVAPSLLFSFGLIVLWTMALRHAHSRYHRRKTVENLHLLVAKMVLWTAVVVLAIGSTIVWLPPDRPTDYPMVVAISALRLMLFVYGIWLLVERHYRRW